MSPATDEQLLGALRRSADELGATAVTDLRVPVPSCPDWTVADLLAHTGQVHRWCQALLAAPPGERVPFGQADPPADEALAAWVASGAATLADLLAADDRDRTVGSWAGLQPVSWWIRRIAHETALHAWDGADACGTGAAYDADLAVDGIDEIFEVWVPRRFDPSRFDGHGETVHLHATDVAGEWLVRFDPDDVVVSREHAKGDVAARGPAADLLLVLWSRRPADPPPPSVEVFGDAGLLARWQQAASF